MGGERHPLVSDTAHPHPPIQGEGMTTQVLTFYTTAVTVKAFTAPGKAGGGLPH